MTNFDMSRYDVNSILESSTLPIGGAAKRLKEVDQPHEMALDGSSHRALTADDHHNLLTSNLNPYFSSSPVHHHLQNWQTLAFQQPHHQNGYSNFSIPSHLPYGHRLWCKQEQDAAELHHQPQLGSTHDFFQQSVLHNLMNIDHPSLEPSSEANSVINYCNNGGDGNVIPMGTVIANDPGSFSENDNNLYNWVPTAVPTVAPRNTMALCRGASTFTVWNGS